MDRSQNERLLEFLKGHRTITPDQAWDLLGIYRLAARVHDLRTMGHRIAMQLVEVPARGGRTARVASYMLTGAGRD